MLSIGQYQGRYYWVARDDVLIMDICFFTVSFSLRKSYWNSCELNNIMFGIWFKITEDTGKHGETYRCLKQINGGY